jgi:protein-ribulosamine 3-kinase
MLESYQQLFESVCFQSLGFEVEVEEFSIVAAGLVNTGAKLNTRAGNFFIKMNEREEQDFFQAEALDLQLIGQALEVPKVLKWGKEQGHNFLLMEFLEEGPAAPKTFEQAGRQLAGLHKIRQEKHGLNRPNFLASIPLDNSWKADGIDFLIQNRILPMVGHCLMEEKISISHYKKIEFLCSKLGVWLPQEEASLLHGDLWSGNLLNTLGGNAVFIDPASHFGFRESEIAFTHLFGSFDAHFYGAYLESFPLETGFEDRFLLYHLHPLLVHLYLFGSSYLPGIERILAKYA